MFSVEKMTLKDAVEAFTALGQESRLAIVRLLFRQDPDGLSAGDIAERLELPAPTLSFHLAHLRRAGLVNSRRDGNSIIYSASYAGMNELIMYLTEDCCRGHSTAVLTTIEAGDGSHEAPARVYRR
jgi:ArsR family transcriptional regulator, arsenate/arsenite/antimonite-responsive transcriptional repressor